MRKGGDALIVEIWLSNSLIDQYLVTQGIWTFLHLKVCEEQENSATSSVQSVRLFRVLSLDPPPTRHPLLILDIASSGLNPVFHWTVFVSWSNTLVGSGAAFCVRWMGRYPPSGFHSLVGLNCFHLFSRLMNQLQIMLQWTMSCKVKTNLFWEFVEELVKGRWDYSYWCFSLQCFYL